MKRTLSCFFCFLFFVCCYVSADARSRVAFIGVDGPNLIAPDGKPFFIKGTNLGNWLNPEGYMFRLQKTNSAGRINQMICEMVGPDFTADFWRKFKDNYVTREDIRFIAGTGANTIRLPFHYKLFTNEDYMGLTENQDGFSRIDSVIKWCREFGLYVILDMHDAPGGQTGDNIDDSYGYPWLFESEKSQILFCEIWEKIARRYKNETVILGYDLLNEPIAPYFTNQDELNARLEPLYNRAIASIRKVDKNHIVILGAPQWNSNFKPFKSVPSDQKAMYSCHRYGGEPTADAIREFIQFRDSVNLPMYMGEIGHNTDEWMSAFCKTMKDNNIGWTFWPYKKMNGSCFVSINSPEKWQTVIDFAEGSRATYKEIRDIRPDQEVARKALLDLIENCKFENCVVQESYIRAILPEPVKP